MKDYVILTKEGYTFAPSNEENEGCEEEVLNLQVLGFIKGIDKQDAVNNFVLENKWAKEAGFSEVYALALGGLGDNDFETFLF